MNIRILTGALCVWMAPLFAAETPALAPDAVKALEGAAAFYAKQPGAAAALSGAMVQEMPGEEKVEMKFKGTLSVERPNLMALRVDSDGGFALVADGKTVWAHAQEVGQYIADDAPKSLEDLIRDNPHVGMMSGQVGPVLDLFRERAAVVMLQEATAAKIVGTEKVGGVDCTHVRGERPEMDWDAWFENGEQPALRRFSFSPMKGILAQMPEEMKAQLKGAKMEISVEYSDWKFGKQPEGAFTFTPPKDAKKVAEFSAPDGEGDDAEPADAMKGKPAPDFKLALLEGGEMSVAQHKGKDVVILDFWATWCGPCVRAMPVIEEVAAAFKDKGVVLYAVNQQEEAADVKKFMAAKKLAMTVAMDAKGDAAKAYQVTGIPQTVVIGKDGNVVAVHVGFSPSLKDELTKEIEAALK